ncbi:TetR family transcriptional regulator [Prauserella marina]|uniref:DNA-binding transcriptional regulator YbjK n=1 Tax=Prauserella marina TaxID=530584 RepID=A0A222VY75_9PSEU|nr:TetR family transcriptional regulator [Prauserella marina]ASR38633.1 TetR family transcriptional regulator [Prauserella marina]PWV81960.1 TetR family transcriptional regulator [Prauserella marina]SDD16231.1 DNA-binding transcriptional regulator YbjK [Prauserella marina]
MTSAASTPKGERRRAALVAAAAQLLAEGGFEAIRHRAVAERAELPLASTTYYFDSLDDLIYAAAEHHGRSELEKGRTQLAQLSVDRRGVGTLVELVLDQLLGSDPSYEAVLLRYERLVATGRRPYLRPLMRTLAGELRELLTAIFVRSGTSIDPQRLDRLIALVDGTVVNALIAVDPDPRGLAARRLHAELA